MKYYEINYENGDYRHGEFRNIFEADEYAQSHNGGYDYTIDEFEDEDEYNEYIENC